MRGDAKYLLFIGSHAFGMKIFVIPLQDPEFTRPALKANKSEAVLKCSEGNS